MPKRRKSRAAELKVLFDTSALYTGSASDLVSYAVAQVIKENSGHPDLRVTWYIPHMVVHERQFQMRTKGADLLQSLPKLEQLLGHSLNISNHTIENSVAERIANQLRDLNIVQFALDTGKIDWSRLISDAAYRNPPFKKGDTEKGFRDAVIVEEFLQIVASSPTSPSICRIALVTADDLLRSAAADRSYGHENVRMFASLEDLKA